MDGLQAVFQAVRKGLINSASLRAIVASTNISVSSRKEPTTYPAIRLRIVGATGNNFHNFLSGDCYIGVYSNHDNPAKQLASIYGILKPLIHDKQSSLTTTNVGISRITEQTCEYPMYQEDTTKYFLMSRYEFTAQFLK